MIYSIFKDKVTKYPESLAFVLEDGRKIAYAQADKIISHIAAKLASKGVKKDDIVGAMFEFESLHPFVFYALDKLNASYAPFDVNTPKKQLEADLEKLNLAVFISSSSRGAGDIEVIQEKTILDCFVDGPTINEDTPTPPRDDSIPVYYVASSGTSSEKKWMGLEGAGLGYWEKTEESQLKLEHGHKVLCTRSPAYDARISEYLRALIAGGTLYLISRHERKNMDFMINYCKEHAITEILLITSQLSGDDLEDKIKRLAKAGIKNLIVTGDACSPLLHKLCIKYKINLFNAYGPTEALFGISIVNVNSLSLVNDNGQSVVPIGLPIGNDIKVHLIDNKLYIESPYLIKGYLNDPEKTALFFPTKMIEGKPKRVFDTGDCFEIKNGLLLFKGRHEASYDSKVIGVKVNSFDVEQLIKKYAQYDPMLIDACVVSKVVSDRTKLVAYLVIKPGFDPVNFIEYLKGWLNASEMPVFMKRASLPIMTVSEKIDRRALIDHIDHPSEHLSISSGKASIRHNDVLTQKLECIWEDLLKLKPKSHDDNFTYQGGDSIVAMRLLKRIQSDIDPHFSHRDLFTLEPITINTIHERLIKQPTVEEEVPMALISPLTHPQRPGRPIVWAPPPLLGDTKYSLPPLAESFGDAQNVNVIGLSDPGIYDISKVPKTMDEAITRYVNAMLKGQPQGPYRLMGFSYGCTLSYHIAAKLQSLGHTVAELHLVDGFSPLFYQKITNEQHAELMKDFSRFIVDVLGNSFYRDPVKMKDLSSIQNKSKPTQINALINSFLKEVKNEISLSLLEVVRNHLLFLLEPTSPIKRHVNVTRFYLSKAGQNFVSLIDEIPDISHGDFDHTYYYWNRYFDKLRRCEMIADCDHLSLIKSKENSRLFFQYTPTFFSLIPFHFEHTIVSEQPYIIQNENDFTLMISNVSYENIERCKNGLLKLNAFTEIDSLRQNIKSYNTKNPKDSFYEDRYILLARFTNEKLGQINQYIDQKLDKEKYKYTPPIIQLGKEHSISDTLDKIKKDDSCASFLKIIFRFKDSLPMEFRFDPISVNIGLLETIMRTNLSRWISLSQKDNNLILEFIFDHTVSGYLLSTVSVGSCMATLLPIIMPYRLHERRNIPDNSNQISPSVESIKLSQIVNSFNHQRKSSQGRKCSIM